MTNYAQKLPVNIGDPIYYQIYSVVHPQFFSLCQFVICGFLLRNKLEY
jgi:hypothetical protein